LKLSDSAFSYEEEPAGRSAGISLRISGDASFGNYTERLKREFNLQLLLPRLLLLMKCFSKIKKGRKFIPLFFPDDGWWKQF